MRKDTIVGWKASADKRTSGLSHKRVRSGFGDTL